ncbi:MAG: manganese catalase family protein [Clostridiales bacterium]|nr:manganese catalase family protein [Clostridiales bacterium]
MPIYLHAQHYKISTGDGELGASLRYLSQRYSMPYAELKGLLTDIGTGESQ